MRAGKPPRRVRGFTYMGVLFLVMIIGLGLSITGPAWTLAAKRARERELLWTGQQYARAIQAYYVQSPGVHRFPDRLEDLLEDRRFPEVRHHLRKMYVDPVSREPFRIVLAPDGRIAGVHSPSDEQPLKQDNFPLRWREFKGMTHYSDWLFIADNAKQGLPTGASAPQAAASAATR